MPDSRIVSGVSGDVRSAVEAEVEGAPYARRLGLALDAARPDGLRLTLPFQTENTNPGDVLHGGVAASVSAIGARAVARSAFESATAPLGVGQIQIAYLAAAKGETVVAEARLLRRGKTLCFVSVTTATEDGKPIAEALATVVLRPDAPAERAFPVAGDDGAADPGPMGPHVVKTPFMSRLGLRIENMQGGRSRIVLPATPENGDAQGRVHDGALLALLDTTGAMASWAETGPGAYRASTPSLQAQIVAPVPPGDLVAYGRLVQREGDCFWADVEVAGGGGEGVARGTVLYRIVP